MDSYKVYIMVDDNGCITGINSSAFLKDAEGWIEIAHGVGDMFMYAQGNFLSKPIKNSFGIPVFKLVNGKIAEREAEEITADIRPPEKTALENRLERLETALNTIRELLAKLGIE